MKKLYISLVTIVMTLLFSVAVFAEPYATLDTDDAIINIVGYTTTKYDGKDLFVALLEYTNMSDDSASPWLTYMVNAYQNGLQLESGYAYGYEYEDFKSADTKVRPNSTLKYFELFELTDNSPVDVEVAPTFNFEKVHAEHTFDLSGGETLEASAEENSEEVSEEVTNTDGEDWEAKYNKLLKKYKKLKKKYKKLKESTENK